MSDRLPQSVQPDRLAESGETLRGTMALKGMTRLAGSLHDTDSTVAVMLEFGIDAQRVKYVRGRLHGVLHLVCQRCLRPMDYPVDIDVSLGLAGSEQEAERLPANYEPLLLGETALSLKGVVEDELILALPIVATHETGQCHADPEHFTDGERTGAAGEEEDRQHPFSGLDELLKKPDPSDQ